jgi:hypothetical protein
MLQKNTELKRMSIDGNSRTLSKFVLKFKIYFPQLAPKRKEMQFGTLFWMYKPYFYIHR